MKLRTRQVTLHVEDNGADYGGVTGPREAIAVAQAVIGDAAQESVLVLMLNARHHVVGYSEVVRGTLNATRLMPRDVYTPALMTGAKAVIMAHNHPSGDPSPSRADRVVTEAIREAGRLLGVPLLDHIVVTARGHYSFREQEGWEDA